MFTSNVKSYNLFELIQPNFVNIFSFCTWSFFSNTKTISFIDHILGEISVQKLQRRIRSNLSNFIPLIYYQRKRLWFFGFSDFHTIGRNNIKLKLSNLFCVLLYQIISQQWSFDNKESLDVSPESNEMSTKQ